ncbi:hypothetical protein CWC18_04025 [Pseudoalteromonas aurantia]|uniref:class I adenylate-forming enzyme family protein n=1 Tax=Pseudoalteromonas aurantia TaxID=43654 RepID=UPI00110AC9BB|nr:class I adenylate-forming enzyme family protein [Pseudoalteromonas aurantia]TMO65871.1 hypothetical protein CWC18_04025 [Pseudoalteromonas aurantia]
MMFSKSLIAQIQADDSIGAGNFYEAIMALPVDLHKTVLSIDKTIPLYAGQQTHFSFNDIQQIVYQVASKYCALGVSEGDLVGLYLDDGLSYFLHYLALNRLGAIPVCINDKLPADTVLAFCKSNNVGVLIHDDDKEAALKANAEVDSPLVNINKLMVLCSQSVPPAKSFTADDVVLLAHTSGTTGIPKAVIFTQHSFFFGVKSQLHKQQGSKVLSALPHSHSSAISVLMSSLLRGAEIYLLSDKRPDPLIHSIKKYQHDLIIAFPKTYVDLCKQPLVAEDFTSVNYWIATGDANHESHIRKLISLGQHYLNNQPQPGSVFIDNLGSSEFGFAMFRNIHSLQTNRFNRCIGKPFSWVEAAILSESGQILPAGKIGKLGVKSATVTAGYWNNKQLTEEAQLAGYWLTGDLAYFDSSGLFYHVDRTSDPINTCDGTIYSCQTEELILRHFTDVFECSIYSGPSIDNDAYSVAHICVELIADAELILDFELLNQINHLLRSHHIPAITSLEFQASNAHTGVTGKKLKRRLRQLREVA